MTEYWKSNPMYWCDYCKVWMNDNPNARATHERGIKHKDNVEKKLRQMRQRADSDKREQALAETTMASIEAKAQAQYERDLQAAAKDKAERIGTWEKQADTGYFYNHVHCYYFDPKTQMYYGGDPAAWILEPPIPPDALFDKALLQAPPTTTAGAPTEGRGQAQPSGAKRRAAEIDHPHASIGGHKMPSVGHIGAGKKVGVLQDEPVPGAKRSKTGAPAGKGRAAPAALSKEEEEARLKREAAKARVEKRTMAAYGLGL